MANSRRPSRGRRPQQKRSPQSLPANTEVEIRDLSHEGRGVARVDERTLFVEGALPGERVEVRYQKRRGKFDEGVAVDVLIPSALRTEPSCPHFSRCGGCQLQHLTIQGQVDHKQQLLLRTLQRLGKVEPECILEPIAAEPWGYRRRARLAVRYLVKEDRVELGFRQAETDQLVPIKQCPVLMAPFSDLIPSLAELIQQLSCRKRIPQIELLAADNGNAVNLHMLAELTGADRDILGAFANQYQLAIYLQTGATDTVQSLQGNTGLLSYSLPDWGLDLKFMPGSFVQVNPEVNRRLIAKAIELLDLKGSEQVLDLFCGLGNFTLPLSRLAARVVGVEGSSKAIELAEQNAAHNGVVNSEFYVADLSINPGKARWARRSYDAVVLDPPRSGAAEMISWIGQSGVSKVLYISCHPGSLARDVGELVAGYGYRLKVAGAVDMFPHTSHLESVVLLEK